MRKMMNEAKEIVAIKAQSKKNGEFFIPVLDVRNETGRFVDSVSKESNAVKGSKYIRKSYSLIGRAYN